MNHKKEKEKKKETSFLSRVMYLFITHFLISISLLIPLNKTKFWTKLGSYIVSIVIMEGVQFWHGRLPESAYR